MGGPFDISPPPPPPLDVPGLNWSSLRAGSPLGFGDTFGQRKRVNVQSCRRGGLGE